MCDTDVTYKFSELNEKAKDRARDEYRSGDYPGYDWWDNTYEDAVRMATLMGINISSTTHKSQRDPNRTWTEPDISFSGFSSQGDGASFEGNYRMAPDAVQKIASETNDDELARIATELSVMQVTRRLQGLEPFSATIKTSGNYCHSNTMDVDVNSEDEDDEHCDLGDIEETVTQLMRDFADWIYKQLEAEHEYLCSDECVDQYLNDSDDEYDEDGSTI